MADSDQFRGKHYEFLHSIDRAWVALDKERDRLRISFRCDARLPPEWVKALAIEFFHDSCSLQETATDLQWTDTEGTLLVATCARPKSLLLDRDFNSLGEVNLPIGDVMLSTPNHAYEHVLYNEYGPKVMSRQFDDMPRQSEILA